MIRIAAKQEGFRRCGVAHSAMPTDWPEERFTADELARLLAEPMLVVMVSADAAGGDADQSIGADLSQPADDGACADGINRLQAVVAANLASELAVETGKPGKKPAK